MIEAELIPYMEELSEMLKICAETSPDHFFNKETGEDQIVEKTAALAVYVEYLAELDDDELISLRTKRRLN